MDSSITSNTRNYKGNDILLAVLDMYFKGDFEMPVFKENVRLTYKELATYTGNYTSTEIPIEINITQENNVLFGQATFALQAEGGHIFTYDQAGVKLIFDPEKETMILNQGRGAFTFKRT